MSDANHKQIVLAVDLDGTLLRGDLLRLSLARLLRRNPLYLVCLPLWLLNGRAAMKREIAKRVDIDPAQLSYHEEVLHYVREQRALGRKTVLASGSDSSLVGRVADHLGCFDRVFASDGRHNRTGSRKQSVLVSEYGARGFDYIGNSRVDIPVWRAAHRVLVAASSRRFSRSIERRFAVERVFWQQRDGERG